MTERMSKWHRSKPATIEPPCGGKQGASGDGMPTEAQLKKIIRDPAYWRDQDPALVEKARTGFRNLYREEA